MVLTQKYNKYIPNVCTYSNSNGIYITAKVAFRCPEKNGYFADPEQCDLYYECIDSIPEAKLCPDGLLFEAENPNLEKW